MTPIMPRRHRKRSRPPEPDPARGRRRWLVPSLLGVIVLAVVVGLALQRPGADPPANALETPEPTASPEPPRATEPAVIASTGPPRLPDPATDGWKSEALHDATTAQLKKLAHLLSATETSPDSASLEKIVAPGFHCSPLRPEKLEEIRRDAMFAVHRAAPEPSDPRHRGVTGFAEALDELMGPLDGTTRRHVKFKQYRIDEQNGSSLTTIRLEASGLAPGASSGAPSTQINATWQCRWSRATPPRLQSVTVVDYEQCALRLPDGPLLVECTPSVIGANDCYRQQLIFGVTHWLRRFEYLLGVLGDGHHGLAVGDVNGDGLDDVYLCQPAGLPNRLFVQNADGTATDTSARAGVDVLDETRAALLVDLDNDGAQDLVLAALRKLLIFAGDGGGGFTLKTELDGRFQFSLAAGDYDVDGDLDLHACNYSPTESDDLDRFGRPVPFDNATNGGRNVLLRNDGDWTFTDVTDEAGLTPTNNRWSYAAAWEDYDDDGDPDLYVANDFGHNNLYRNDRGPDGSGPRFTDVAVEANAVDANFGMSVSWGDPNRDGRMDLYISNMFSAAGNRVTFQKQFRSGDADRDVAIFQRMARGNTLLLGGDGPFRDASPEAGTTMGRWSWASLFADVDNDGWEDLLVTNGFLTNELKDDL